MSAAQQTFYAAAAIMRQQADQVTGSFDEACKAKNDDIHTISSAIILASLSGRLDPMTLLTYVKGNVVVAFQLGYAAGYAAAAKEGADD